MFLFSYTGRTVFKTNALTAKAQYKNWTVALFLPFICECRWMV